MLAQLVSVALTAPVKATDTKSVSSFNHFHICMILDPDTCVYDACMYDAYIYDP